MGCDTYRLYYHIKAYVYRPILVKFSSLEPVGDLASERDTRIASLPRGKQKRRGTFGIGISL